MRDSRELWKIEQGESFAHPPSWSRFAGTTTAGDPFAPAPGVALVLFSLSRALWLSALLLVPVGGAVMVQLASSNTLVQTMTPDPLRGRVMAVYTMVIIGMAPLGALIAGAAASRIGAPATVAAGGFAIMAAAAVFASRLPDLGQETRRLVLSGVLASGEPQEAPYPTAAPAPPADAR